MTKKGVVNQQKFVAQQNHQTRPAIVLQPAIAKQTVRVTAQVNVAKVVTVNCQN